MSRRSFEILTAAIGVAMGLASSVTLGVAHPPAQLSLEQEKGTIEEVVAFRKTIVEAIAAKDAAKLRAMYAGSFRHTHDSGRIDGKDARIVSLLSGEGVIETAPVTGLEISIPGGWTAIATGKSPVKALPGGKTYDFRWTAVYVRNGDSWQLAASQATRLAEVKP